MARNQLTGGYNNKAMDAVFGLGFAPLDADSPASWQFMRKDANDRSFVRSHFCIGVATAKFVFHKICALEPVVKFKYCPQKLKIRNKFAAAQAKWLPL